MHFRSDAVLPASEAVSGVPSAFGSHNLRVGKLALWPNANVNVHSDWKATGRNRRAISDLTTQLTKSMKSL